jgi:hypothetical protein
VRFGAVDAAPNLRGMLLIVQIAGVWTVFAVVAGTLLGRALSSTGPTPQPMDPALPGGRSVTAAAAGSTVAAFGVFALVAPTL